MTGIIIAGGKSKRMGKDKAFILYKGKKLVEHAIQLLDSFCDHIVISNNQPEKYSKYPYHIIKDTYTNIGPLGGLHASLFYTKSENNIVIPCDMPLIRKELISLLIDKHLPNCITIPEHNGHREPLCAVYPKTAIATIETMIKQGNYKLYNLLENHPTQIINVDHLTDKYPDMLNNLNEPSDL